jgi:hypothetical protein
MAWHEAVSLEVLVEFARLSVSMHSRMEDALWTRLQYRDSRWSDHSVWWRRTAKGRAHRAAWARAWAAKAKTITVAVRGCAQCGRPFAVTAYREARGKARVCSQRCAGLMQRIQLVTIDGVTLSTREWAERFGISLQVVRSRRAHGWDVVRALQTPLANRGQKRRAA